MVVDEWTRGSMRETLSSAVAVTQTAPAPTVTPLGRRPTLTVGPSRAFVAGLKRVTVLSDAFATQTDPLPKAIADGKFPANIEARTAMDEGLIRVTDESLYVTQTEPAPVVTPPQAPRANEPAGLVLLVPYCGSTRESVPSRPCATQTALRP